MWPFKKKTKKVAKLQNKFKWTQVPNELQLHKWTVDVITLNGTPFFGEFKSIPEWDNKTYKEVNLVTGEIIRTFTEKEALHDENWCYDTGDYYTEELPDFSLLSLNNIEIQLQDSNNNKVILPSSLIQSITINSPIPGEIFTYYKTKIVPIEE